MLVKDVMTSNVIVTSTETNIKEAAKSLADNHIGSLIVMKKDQPIGILTGRNILCALAESGTSSADRIEIKKVGDVMTDYIIPVGPRSGIQKAVNLMIDNKIKKLPVIDNDVLVGIITASDIITAQSKLLKDIQRLLMGRGEKQLEK
jgi:CBS domain-containing protein